MSIMSFTLNASVAPFVPQTFGSPATSEVSVSSTSVNISATSGRLSPTVPAFEPSGSPYSHKTSAPKMSATAPAFEPSGNPTTLKPVADGPTAQKVAGASPIPEVSDVAATSDVSGLLIAHESVVPTVDEMSEPITGFESDINSDISVEDKLVVFATKTESIELPGSLASSGPRHDNDHEDISKIQILPTMSEIQAIRPEYLPRKNTRSFHENHLQGYLDAQFRLLRRNCIGPLIDTIRQSWLQQLALCDEIPNSKKGMELYRAFGYSEAYQPPNTHCYFNLEVLNVEFHEGRGQIADVRFEQPPTIQNLVAGQRARWWAESGRLGTGALMCMLDVDGHQLFCAPLDEPSFPLDNERDVYCMMTRTVGKGVNATVPKDLFSDRKWAYTRLRITTCSNEMHTNLVRFFTNSPAKQCLVEQPGTLVPSFKPSLDVLQEYSQTRNMPFADLLCCSGQTGLITMAPPAYSNDEFRFNLRSIMKDGRSAFLTPHKHFEMDVLREGSSLDEGQAKALVNALTSRIALIQGPPGTGKSFTGEAIARVLLDNREKAQLGPLVIMAQTNHALDEVLERMKPFCPEGVIRIGTGSKSSSQWLSHYNLKKQAWRKGSPRDQHQTSKLRAERTVAAKECENLLSNIRNASNDKWAMANEVQELLASICPNRHTQIFGQRHGELQDARTALQNWIDSGCETNFTPRPLISLQEADMIIATFSREERISISDYWFDQQLELTKREYETAAAKWQQATDKIAEIRQGQDLLCLQDAKVIGVTSAGMTSRKKTFDLLKSKVMICEEAGEILEANTIAALYQSLEHVIMIGDHQQLRPHVGWDMSVYNSKGRAFSLDISLFERLVGHSDNDGTTMRLPVTTLSTQRRMHPSISRFTRLQYENLEDGENVHEYPQVAGMKDRLYWIDHTEYEDNVGRLAAEVNPSASNQYEVDYICALVEYLVRQGRYETKDIAVIVPYGSQERKIRDKLSKVKSVRQKAAIDDQDDWFGDEKTEKATFMAPTSLCVRISTIDNFQGEQADVIIASLTRSNPNQSMGFLSFDARINVLLSRAKHGMYIFGSRSNFSSGSGIWPKVIGTLERDGLIGTELKLECPRHPENKIIIRGPQDFLTKAPQGGCDVRCGKPLACGHECHAPCHSDLMHSHHECQDRCQRKFDCGHQCRKLCFEECDEVCPMMDTELGRKLACGHDGTSVPCHLTKFLPGKDGIEKIHNPNSAIKNPLQASCKKMVLKVHPLCEHIQRVQCGKVMEESDFLCTHVDATMQPFDRIFRQDTMVNDDRATGSEEALVEGELSDRTFQPDYDVDIPDLNEPSHPDYVFDLTEHGWRAPSASVSGFDASSRRYRDDGPPAPEDCYRIFDCGHVHVVAEGEPLWRPWVACPGYGDEITPLEWVWPESLDSSSLSASSVSLDEDAGDIEDTSPVEDDVADEADDVEDTSLVEDDGEEEAEDVEDTCPVDDDDEEEADDVEDTSPVEDDVAEEAAMSVKACGSVGEVAAATEAPPHELSAYEQNMAACRAKFASGRYGRPKPRTVEDKSPVKEDVVDEAVVSVKACGSVGEVAAATEAPPRELSAYEQNMAACRAKFASGRYGRPKPRSNRPSA